MRTLIHVFIQVLGALIVWGMCSILALCIYSCSTTRPQISNKPSHITLAKYRVGDIIKYPKYQDCVARIINIIEEQGNSEYLYQVVLSCEDGSKKMMIPQYYLENIEEGNKQ